jgi:hypothetical protein
LSQIPNTRAFYLFLHKVRQVTNAPKGVKKFQKFRLSLHDRFPRRVASVLLDLSPWSVAALGQGQKPESASGKARGRGGLGLRLIVLVLNDPHSTLTREPVPHVGHVVQLLSSFRCFTCLSYSKTFRMAVPQEYHGDASSFRAY